jgi:hypothetical protein
MARFISPITDMKPNGSLRFFKSGTNTRLTTYKDEFFKIPNAVSVSVLPNGNVENVFFKGTAKVLYLDEFEQQYAERDPVGGESELGSFSTFNINTNYSEIDIVKEGNKFYVSLSDSNQGNLPSTSPDSWEEWPVNGIYNATIDYGIGDVTQTDTGSLWRSLVTPNIGNDPELDNGTNWIPAINGSKVPEIIALQNLVGTVETVVTHTGGGTVTRSRINELQDANTGYLIPLAADLDNNEYLTITQPLQYTSNVPVVSASGSDVITISGGNDTSITFNQSKSIDIRLTSNGVDEYRLTVI